ncbi:MAG: helix-turn-helix transcriptional regulator [Bacillota bacterium]|nr:helix-turn-helix transcriptional regulator [Bacillota bacterium]
MKRHGKRNLFIRYISLFFGVMLMVMVTVLAIFVVVSGKQLNESISLTLQQNMQNAAEDLDNQLEVFKKISYDIKVNIYYKQSFVNRKVINEMQMIDLLDQFQTYSVLSKSYFYFFKDADQVYFPKAKNDFVLYATSILKVSDVDALYSKLNNIERITIIKTDNNLIIVAIPIFEIGASSNQMSSVISFILTESELISRFEETSGIRNANISIYYNKQELAETSYKQTNVVHNNSTDNRIPVISVKSSSNQFEVHLQPESGWYFSVYDLLIVRYRWYILGSISIVIVLSFVLAYILYKPVKGIAGKYNRLFSVQSESGNELDQIELMLNQSLMYKIDTMASIQKQFILLKEQLILILINGKANDSWRKQMDSIGFPMDSMFFCVIIIEIRDSDTSTCDENQLCNMIEELSYDLVRFLAVRGEKENQIIVLLNFDESDFINDAKDMLSAILSTTELDYNLYEGIVCSEIERVKTSYMLAFSSCIESQHHRETQSGSLDSSFRAINDIQDQLVLAVRKADMSLAEVYLSKLIGIIETSIQSQLMFKVIYTDTLSKLIKQFVDDANYQEMQAYIGDIVLADSLASFQSGLQVLLVRLCEYTISSNQKKQSVMCQKLMEALQSKALEYDFSIEKLAEMMNISANYVSIILKDQTGRTFKEHIVGIRIDEAKRLLLESTQNVSAISINVGYLSVSYFIKIFKEAVGLTPAKYRELQPMNRNQ